MGSIIFGRFVEYADNQSAGKERSEPCQGEDEKSGLEVLPSKTRSLSEGVYYDA
jgi:hypothetical protein